MRTRPGLKSCLKITPPITPDLSAASSPCGSGRTSPSLTSDGGSSASSCGRKTVAFCPEDDLEEVFWADEWDRTPAAVTPKLSYQDILELKQLRISLPYSPPPPTSRQPFTTSPPAAGPSTKPPFPVSRFATGPSHTPSKWKNRSEPRQSEVDPEILPYLDAVPIRLLPLLPQSPSETAPTDAPEPHPQTPTPTASPEHRAAPPPPSEPPEIKIEPPAPAPLPNPPPKKHNFAFVPLLPVQDQPQVSPPPIIVPSAPTRPKRTFNMTFLPVNAVHEPAPLAPAYATSTADASMGTPSSAPLPSSSCSVIGSDPKPNDAGQLAPPSPTSPSSSHTPIASTALPPAAMSPPPMSLPLPASSRYALESDNETEADTTDTCVSDTDAESDAPSTSTFGSSLPSPPLEDDVDVETRLEQIKLGTFEHDQEACVRTQDPGSYFPPVSIPDTATSPIAIPIHPEVVDGPPALPSGPGQTPPLSVLYPSPTSQHQPLLPLDAISSAGAAASAPSIPSSHPQPPSTCSDGIDIDVPSIPISPSLPLSVATGTNEDVPPTTPLSMSNALKKKLMLEALPSPALVPPSPFELEPLGSIDASPTPASSESSSHDRLTVAELKAGVLSGAADRLSEKLAALSMASEHRAGFGVAADTPNESPLLTLESMRDVWDARARVGLGVGVEVGERLSMSALSPSLSRRRSS
ncbi:hypothetical protein C8Q70DRAFT_930374 [Cubamyces menziesii]|uniref:Uncharacterized protein n=1 Tax=Trametes cubensis TaxID=1111947 RepID=A0AAD7X7M3_9APHY|nr:hypothetical protein C8Q70DRAFT_930374 [Cubamyces menziesii]KAJ8474405.1 hypothetical protein ONZ51_g7241 [Trametes cubensis]